MKKLLFVFLSGIVLFAACKQPADSPGSSTPPKITKNLSADTPVEVTVGGSAELKVNAKGSGTLSYEWYQVTGTTKKVVGNKSTSNKFTVGTEYTKKDATFVFFCRVYNKESGKPSAHTDSVQQTVKVGNGGQQGGGASPAAETPALNPIPSVNSWVNREFTLEVTASHTTAEAWTYQWYKAEDEEKKNAQKMEGATEKTYTTKEAAAGTYYYYCTVTNAPTGKTAASKDSNVVKVTVAANPPTEAQVPNVTVVQGNCSINAGEQATLSVHVQVTDTGVLSYQWYTTTETTATGGTVLTGETKSSVNVSPTQTTKYYCQVTNTLNTGASTPLTATQSSTLITVTVNTTAQPVQPAQITAPTSEQSKTTVAGTPIKLSVTAQSPDSGTLTYQWYKNTAKSTLGGELISEAKNSEYSFPAQSAGTYYFYCEVTNTKGGKSADPVKSPVFTVTVTQEKQPAVNPTITKQLPATLKLQKNDSETIEITASCSDGGTLSYEWYQSNTGTDEGTKLTNAAATLTIPTNTVGTKYYRCKVTNTNQNAQEGHTTASIFTNWCKVEVTEEDTLGKFTVTASGAASARIAKGKTAEFKVQINNKPDGTQQGIQWYKGTPPADNTAAPAGTAAEGTGNTETYTTPASLTAGMHTFYCQVTMSKQVGTETKTVKKYSPAFTVTVVEPAAPTITTQPQGGQALKSAGVPLTITAKVDSSNNIGTPKYQWYKHTKKEAANGTLIDGATTAAYTAKEEAPFYHYYCVVSNSEDTSKKVTSGVVTAIIYRDPAAIPVDMNVNTEDGLGWGTQNWELGSKKAADGTTFAVYSKNAERMMLEIYDAETNAEPKGIFVMEKGSGDIWRAKINTNAITGKVYYGYRAWGPNWTYDPEWTPGTNNGYKADVDEAGNRFNPNKLLTDPYSRELSHTRGIDGSFYQTGTADRNKDSGNVAPKSVVVEPLADIGTVKSASSALTAEIIYQLHVKGFTGKGTAGIDSITGFSEPDKGTYAGAAKMIPYLKGLGVNTVLLMPVFESEGLEDYRPANFFAVKKTYAKSQENAAQEFQDMVNAFHTANMQVFLDVPYANSGEDGKLDNDENKVRLESLRGLDNTAYYALSSSNKKDYWVSTGNGNNLNGSSQQVQDLILASLKYWTETMGIDGFRFSSGAALGRTGDNWDFSKDAPLLSKIKDYLHSKSRKCIIETMDKNSTGNEVFNTGWIAWNNTFRDSVRKTVNWIQPPNESKINELIGKAGTLNFAASHDSYRLADILDAENIKIGEKPEYSANFNQINTRRERYRNLLILTILSKGTPMLTYGDEFGRAQGKTHGVYGGITNTVQMNDYSHYLTHKYGCNELGGDDSGTNLLYEFTKKLLKLRNENATFFKDATYTFKKFDNSDGAEHEKAFCILISNADKSVEYAVCVNNTDGKPEALVKEMGGGTASWKPLIDTGSWAEPKNDGAKMEGNFYAEDKDALDKYGVEANRIVVLKKQ
ncbi:MAG: alpha-amylase family glycosyl hydrolase [Treponema sp.]